MGIESSKSREKGERGCDDEHMAARVPEPTVLGQRKRVFGEPTSADADLKVHEADIRCRKAMVSIWEP